MKILSIIVVVFLVGNSPTSPSPAPLPAPKPVPAPRPVPAPAPAPIPPLIIAGVSTLASSPVVRNAAVAGTKIAIQGTKVVATTVGNAARSSWQYTTKQLGTGWGYTKDFLAKIRPWGRKSPAAAPIAEAAASGVTSVATPGKSPLSKVLSITGKVADGVVQASNVAVGVASVVQISQLNAANVAASVSSCSKVQFSELQPKCSLVSGGPGGFTLISRIPFKITWNDKSSTCREDILNVDDFRPAFEQRLLQVSQKASTNFELETHRNAVKNCGPFPKISLAQGKPRELKRGRPRQIPEKVSAGLKILAWKGLDWFTDLVFNTCIFDSFFTYMMLKLKLDNDYAGRNFLIPQDPAEALLRVMSEHYQKQPSNPDSATIKKYSQNIKVLWIKTFFPEFKTDLANKKKIDFKGHEYYRVITFLNPSSTIYLTGTCQCQQNNAPKVLAKKAFYISVDFAELKHLSRETGNPLIKNPLAINPWFQGTLRNQQKSCNTCTTKMQLDYVFTPTSTWFLYFMFDQTTKITNSVPNIFQIPKKVNAMELFFYNKLAVFELAYITCSTTQSSAGGLTHVVSFQFFNNKFYYYDDVKGGELIYAPDPNLTIKAKLLIVRDVTYLRP